MILGRTQSTRTYYTTSVTFAVRCGTNNELFLPVLELMCLQDIDGIRVVDYYS